MTKTGINVHQINNKKINEYNGTIFVIRVRKQIHKLFIMYILKIFFGLLENKRKFIVLDHA